MYEKHFGLTHKPFAITPDPRYLYLSVRHREALAHLLYGVGEGGGFVQLTGEVGTGKTTLCRSLLEQLPAAVDVALILHPRLDAVELVAAICDELGASYPAGSNSLKVLVSALNAHLLKSHAAGRRTVLLIDEAQNLTPEVLEQVRLLTNLETAETKLLEIILIGQPELRDMLERRELRQLAQRITARYHLEPLTPDETAAYVRHRLRIAGISRPIFTNSALKNLARLSNGVPRLINVICDRALLGAYVEEQAEVDVRILRRAAREVRSERNFSGGRWSSLAAPEVRRNLLLVMLAMMLVSAGILAYQALPARNIPISQSQAARPGHNSDSSVSTAWGALFKLWGADFHAGQDPCVQARTLGLRCFTDTGSWTVLRRLDRPALLWMHDPDGMSRIVLLSALTEREGELEVDGAKLHLPLSTIEQSWSGEYRILWRPPLAAELLRKGDRGPEVLRLRAILDRQAAKGKQEQEKEEASGTLPVRPDLFDADLVRRVIAFQVDHGLQADGIVGPRTMLQMSEVLAGPETPRLGSTD